MENYEKESNPNESQPNKTFKDSSPDEIKDRVKETVAKGVAAVAGALKGFSDEAKKDDLAGSTKQAIQKAGETTRELAGTAKEEFQQTKQEVKGGTGGSDLGSTSMGGSYGSDVGGSTTGGSDLGSKVSDVPDLRKSDLSKSDDELDRS